MKPLGPAGQGDGRPFPAFANAMAPSIVTVPLLDFPSSRSSPRRGDGGWRRATAILASVLVLVLALDRAAFAQVRLADISRIKGQEDNELIGTGLVVGLPGTGDGGNVLPSIRALANMLDRMGHPLPEGLKELKQCKNVALVEVRATIPASGSREGNRIDCVVSS